jgi:G3E family GTPase
VETSDESFVTLQTGCLCCTVRGDLVQTLEDLLRRRQAGAVADFKGIVIETSGLADPAPILHAVMQDPQLSARLSLTGVVTTVDAVNGLATLARQPESVKQVAVADRLVLTKSDLLDADPSALVDQLSAINPMATMLTACHGVVDPEQLLGTRPGDLTYEQACLRLDASVNTAAHAHDAEICCFAVVRDKPLRAVTLTLLLEALSEHCGSDLLRLKGIVMENPGQPAIIHGVQHVFHPPRWANCWPSGDHRTRLIFIARGIRQSWIEALFAAVEAEVEELTC